MNAFAKRYFVWIALILLVFSGLFLLEIKNKIFIIFPIILMILGAIFYCLRTKKQKFVSIFALMMTALIVANVNAHFFLQSNEKEAQKYLGEHKISGYVSEVVSKQSFFGEHIIHVESVDGEQASFDIILVTDFESKFSRGDFISADAYLTRTDEYANFTYLRNNNLLSYPLICELKTGDEIELLERSFRPSLVLSALNSKLSARLSVFLGNKAGPLASALLLGNRELLPDDVLRDFRRAGVYHMLALSGLHVAILIGLFEMLLKKLLVSKRVRIVLLLVVSLFYIALTGFLPSACRSMLMLWAVYLAFVMKRDRDSMTFLFLAVSIIVLINPSAIFDVGLQLSFLSTFGVISAGIIKSKISFFEIQNDKRSLKGRAIQLAKNLVFSLLISVCVFVSTLPAIMIYFGELSLATFFSNLFMGALCEAFMILALLVLLVSWLGNIALPIVAIAKFVGEILLGICTAISDLRGVMLSLQYPFMGALVWGVFIGSLIFFGFKFYRRWLVALPSVIFAVLLSVGLIWHNVQSSDSVVAEFIVSDELVISSGGEVYICDMSDGSFGALYEGVSLARENCFTEVEGVILTHYHSNHSLALQRLSNRYKIRTVLLPKPVNSDEEIIMRTIIRLLEENGAKVYIYLSNDVLDIGLGKLVISERAFKNGRVNPSVAISYSYLDKRITVVERPYFDTYLDESGSFDEFINSSDYLIFGSDGKLPESNFEIFKMLKEGCEVCFTDFDMMEKSDFEEYMDEHSIFFDVEYKKYVLK